MDEAGIQFGDLDEDDDFLLRIPPKTRNRMINRLTEALSNCIKQTLSPWIFRDKTSAYYGVIVRHVRLRLCIVSCLIFFWRKTNKKPLAQVWHILLDY